MIFSLGGRRGGVGDVMVVGVGWAWCEVGAWWALSGWGRCVGYLLHVRGDV